MLIAVTAVAVLFGLFAFPFGRLVFVLLYRGVIPTVAVVAAIYGRDDLRAFAIGAMVVCVPILTTELGPLTYWTAMEATIAELVAIGACGFAAVAARRWIMRPGGSDAK
jgi:hypothetical protein